MYKKVLVACDGSDGSNLALDRAALLARRLDAKVTALWVRHWLPHFPETVDEIAAEEESAKAFLEDIKSRVRSAGEAAGVTIEMESCAGHPAQQIAWWAMAGGFDLAVLGNRGHADLWGRLLGHTANRVAEHCTCDVLIVRDAISPARKSEILVGYDSSDTSRFALQKALALAATKGSHVEALWIHERAYGKSMEPRDYRIDDDWAANFFGVFIKNEVADLARGTNVPVASDFRCGEPAKILIERATSGGFELIALGHRSHSGLLDLLLGGTADRVGHYAPCDVLIVKQPPK